MKTKAVRLMRKRLTHLPGYFGRMTVVHPTPDPIGRRRVVQGAAIAAGDQVQQIGHGDPAADARKHGAAIVTAPDLASQALNVDLLAGVIGKGAGSPG